MNLIYYNNTPNTPSRPPLDDDDSGGTDDEDDVPGGTEDDESTDNPGEDEIETPDGSIKTEIQIVNEDDGSGWRIAHKKIIETKNYQNGSKDVTTKIYELKIPIYKFDPFTDYNTNTPSANWNSPNYRFAGNAIDDWFITVNFGDGNIPAYKFIESPGRTYQTKTLEITNTTKSGSESKHNIVTDWYKPTDGENKVSSPMNLPITKAEFHRFSGENPLRVPANEEERNRTQRFRFYHFIGNAFIDMDQYLCAVDTYSKFVWAYVCITKTKNTAGQDVPIAFDAVENYDPKLMFWEYDPIGYVNANGSVTLYGQYKRDMAANGSVNFFPQIHNPDDPPASAKSTGEGHSPYYWKKVPAWYMTPETIETLIFENTEHFGGDYEISHDIFLEKVSDKSFLYRPKAEPYSYVTKTQGTGGQNTMIIEDGYGVNSYSCVFSNGGRTLTYTEKDDRSGNKLSTVWIFDEKQKLETETSAKYINNATTATIELTSDEDGVIIKKDGQKVGIENFSDPGPDFILIVKNQMFTKNNALIKFSADGGSVKVKNMDQFSIASNKSIDGNGTYYFVGEKNGNKKIATYEHYGSKAQTTGGILGGIGAQTVLSANPWYAFTLGDDYTTIYRSRGENNGTDPSASARASEICERSSDDVDDQDYLNLTVTTKSIEISDNMKTSEKDTAANTAYMISVLRSAMSTDDATPDFDNIFIGNDKEDYSTNTLPGDAFSIPTGGTYTISDNYVEYSEPVSKNPVLYLDTRMRFHTAIKGVFELLQFKTVYYIDNANSKQTAFTNYGAPQMKFVYDDETRSIKYESMNGTSTGVAVENGWEVSENDEKDFVITLTKNGYTCKVTYSISFTIE